MLATDPIQGSAPALRQRTIGFITSVRGSDVSLDLPPHPGDDLPRATVGSFVGILVGSTVVVGTLTKLSARTSQASSGRELWATGDLDLLGEIAHRDGAACFSRGVTDYPAIGDEVELLGRAALELVFGGSGQERLEIGSLHQDHSIPAMIKVNEMLTKHFAVLGTTGVGKSSGVAILLQGVLESRPDMRIFLLDAHNEYGRCFGERAHVVDPRTLKLPFWVFNFEEIVDAIYGGRPHVIEEVEVLAELIPLAKAAYGQHKAADRGLVRRNETRATGFTVDTPVPYLLQDLLALIDERMGRLENRSSRMTYHRLTTRIETIRSDPRYAFMFQNANVGGDTLGELLVQLFRLEPAGKPMCVLQLAGLPVEVTDAVVCVLCRLAFDFGLWSEGAVPLLVVCEEAHRFASADHAVGFHPTRRALSRIAKEGRKYGVYLGLVTQRPAELDATIISQCSTLFAMRLSNERDQTLLRSAVSDGAADLMSFVPSLGTREVIGFGEGVSLSARMTFKALPPHLLPRSEAFGSSTHLSDSQADRDFVKAVVDRWRGASLGGRHKIDDTPDNEPAPKSAALSSQVMNALDQKRQRLLTRQYGEAETTPPPMGQTRLQR